NLVEPVAGRGRARRDLTWNALYKDRRRDDRDSPERIKREEIGIAGDDQISIAVYRQLQKLVVVRITTAGDPLGDRDQLGCCQQFTQPIRKARRDQWRKTRPI